MASPCNRALKVGAQSPCFILLCLVAIWTCTQLYSFKWGFDVTEVAQGRTPPGLEVPTAIVLPPVSQSETLTEGGLENSVRSLRDQFLNEGYLGPFTLEHKQLYNDALEGFNIRTAIFPSDWSQYYRQQSQPHWFKQDWVAVPQLYALATHPQIVGILKEVLGPDVMLWGAHMLQRDVGVTHKWHTEIEVGPCNASATLWLGVKGTTSNTSLQVIAHSKGAGPLIGRNHSLSFCRRGRRARRADTNHIARERSCIHNAQKQFKEDGDMYAARAANITGKPARVVKFNMIDGDFVFFQGQTWHGGPTTDSIKRVSAVFQYAHPSCAMRQLLADDHTWPNSHYPQSMSLVHMIAGAATAEQKVLNHHYEPGLFSGKMHFDNVNEYAHGNSGAPLALGEQKVLGIWKLGQPPNNSSAVLHLHSLQPASVAGTPAASRNVHHFEKGMLQWTLGTYSTAHVLEFIECAAIKFNFGHPIHTLLRHGSYEELVYVVEGQVVVHRAEEGSQYPVQWVFEAGSLIYHAPTTAHTASCMDQAGCTILQYHWRPVDRPPSMTPPERGPTPLRGAAWLLHKSQASKPVNEWAVLGSGLGMHLHVDEYPAGQAVVLRAAAHDAIVIAVQGTALVLPENTTLQAGDSAIIPAGCQLSFTAGSSSTNSSALKLAMLELHPKVLPAGLATYYDKSKSPWHVLQPLPAE